MADQMTVLISSHDLAEIESFATHVGYLDAGRLRFSEELPWLQGRFREVEVTLTEPAGLGGLPESARSVGGGSWTGPSLYRRGLRPAAHVCGASRAIPQRSAD